MLELKEEPSKKQLKKATEPLFCDYNEKEKREIEN